MYQLKLRIKEVKSIPPPPPSKDRVPLAKEDSGDKEAKEAVEGKEAKAEVEDKEAKVVVEVLEICSLKVEMEAKLAVGSVVLLQMGRVAEAEVACSLLLSSILGQTLRTTSMI